MVWQYRFTNENVFAQIRDTTYFKKNKLDDAKAFPKPVKNDRHRLLNPIVGLGDIYYLDNNLDKTYDAPENISLNNKDATLITNISSVLYEKGNKAECLTFNKNLLSENDSLLLHGKTSDISASGKRHHHRPCHILNIYQYSLQKS